MEIGSLKRLFLMHFFQPDFGKNFPGHDTIETFIFFSKPIDIGKLHVYVLSLEIKDLQLHLHFKTYCPTLLSSLTTSSSEVLHTTIARP